MDTSSSPSFARAVLLSPGEKRPPFPCDLSPIERIEVVPSPEPVQGRGAKRGRGVKRALSFDDASKAPVAVNNDSVATPTTVTPIIIHGAKRASPPPGPSSSSSSSSSKQEHGDDHDEKKREADTEPESESGSDSDSESGVTGFCVGEGDSFLDLGFIDKLPCTLKRLVLTCDDINAFADCFNNPAYGWPCIKKLFGGLGIEPGLLSSLIRKKHGIVDNCGIAYSLKFWAKIHGREATLITLLLSLRRAYPSTACRLFDWLQAEQEVALLLLHQTVNARDTQIRLNEIRTASRETVSNATKKLKLLIHPQACTHTSRETIEPARPNKIKNDPRVSKN